MDAISTWFLGLDPTLIPLGALVTFMVFGLIRGWVVPRQVHLDRVSDKDDRIKMLSEERNDWKQAFLHSEESRRILLKQNSDLITSAETTNRLMESLRDSVERKDGS